MAKRLNGYKEMKPTETAAYQRLRTMPWCAEFEAEMRAQGCDIDTKLEGIAPRLWIFMLPDWWHTRAGFGGWSDRNDEWHQVLEQAKSENQRPFS